VDYNNDGKIDIIAGDSAGTVTVFLNTGTKTKPVLAAGVPVEADGKTITPTRRTYKRVDGKYTVDKEVGGSHKLADSYTKIHLADWNGDDLPDLLVGHNSTMILYRNTGTKAKPVFAAPVEIKPAGGKFPSRPSPYVVDWDGDGKRDLLVGTEGSAVMFYRNTGTNKKPQLAEGKDLGLKVPEPRNYRWRIDVTDWNNDGKKDILLGNFYSGEKNGKRTNGGNVWLFLGK
jgi:hypothetical protein